MKPLTFLAVLLCLLFVAATAFAVPISVYESASAFIAPDGGGAIPWYSSNYNGSAFSTCPGGNPAAGYPLWCMILWKFNLSSWSGLTFNGNVAIRDGMSWGEYGTLPFRLFTVVSNWTETTVTWQNFLGPNTTNNNPPFGNYPNNNQAFTNVLGVELALTACTGTTNAGTVINFLGTNYWVFPGTLVQHWLNNPADNMGVALVPQWYGNKMWCTRGRTWDMIRTPTLMADVVPEPAIFVLGFVAMLFGLRRR
ncbi:hypothetical protein GX586_00760 [bacterium]|nr:hypothetical protein [bacterium]